MKESAFALSALYREDDEEAMTGPCSTLTDWSRWSTTDCGVCVGGMTGVRSRSLMKHPFEELSEKVEMLEEEEDFPALFQIKGA